MAQNSPRVAIGGQEVLRLQNVPTAGPSRCAIPDVQCGPLPLSASALWQTNWWSRFEDKGSPAARGWDLADFWFWCLLHETYPPLFILLDSCTSHTSTHMSCMTMYMHVHHRPHVHACRHPQLTLLKFEDALKASGFVFCSAALT